MKKTITTSEIVSYEQFNQAFAVFILFFTFTSFSYSQIPIISNGPLKPGQSIVTSYDPVNTLYNAVRVIDIRNSPPFLAGGNLWNPNSYAGADWTQARMGFVYGITLDDADPPNIYISRSTVYCDRPEPLTGLIYKINGSTWTVSDYVIKNPVAGPPVMNVNSIPNTGPGLGNLCFDKWHQQIFTTNHEDGKIYRIKGSVVGNVQSVFDPFGIDGGTSPGFVVRGERIWGIGVYGGSSSDARVYFGRWVSDNLITTNGANEIWSAALDNNGEFIAGSIRLEIILPPGVLINHSNPVSDIEFSQTGNMLLGERTMYGDMGACTWDGPWAHHSRIMEYPRNTSGHYDNSIYTWHYVGLLHQMNSTGGVDYEYGYADSVNNVYSDCDKIIVGTGDYLYNTTSNQLIYGVQFSDKNFAGNPDHSHYIDLNGSYGWNDKTTLGDIDVYRKYACQPVRCELNNYPWEKVGNTGAELNSMVYALSPFQGKLIAGGRFTQASGIIVNGIASWDGSIWQPLGNGLTALPYGEVNALTVFQNKLIAGGRFSNAGNVSANNIAQWDGSNWTSIGIGSGDGTNGTVHSITVHNNKLIVGGSFTNAGGNSVVNIAQWDGSTWSAIGSGINGSVNSLLSFNGELIAGGVFTTAGSVTVNNITKWNGSSWVSLGSGVNLINGTSQGVGALANYNNELVAGGRFNNAGGVAVNFIAKWNGSSWSDLGGGLTGSYEGVYSLLVRNNVLYVGGDFTNAGTVSANSVAKWDGNVWKALGNGVTGLSGPGIVLTLMNHNNSLYAGGEFISPDYSWIVINPCESTDPIGINYENNLVPDNYYLYQNYPNPFNPTTKIKFTLPENSYAKLAVYDALGKEVETLVNEKLSSGSYESNWNASGYPSGIYFYKLTANNFIQTKKMIFLK